MRVEPELRLSDGQAVPSQIACINPVTVFCQEGTKTVCARLVTRHSCDVGYLASVPGVQGGSGIRRELRWPVKYDQSHWRCTRSRFCSCGRERM
jgi:hypothetical protein